MPITATYTPAQFKLSVLGTASGEAMTVSRNAAGTLLVNAGAVPIAGGPATVANTDIIEVVGDAGSDIIALDEATGALPAAELSGGAGNDTLTGGSAGDTLAGEGDDDTLFGRGGIDLLFGGSGNDTLTGGDANDQMFGEDGNDLLVWNPGDDSDLMEGGAGSDTVQVNGGGGGEVFTVTANGTRVRFDRIDPAPFTLDIGTTENLVLNAGAGNDTISTSGNLAALISLTLDGQAGNDTILGGNGIDTLLGGDGDDFIDGQQGNDVALLGAGNDTFQWDPGDGSDIVEGQAGIDALLFNGSAANEIFALSANGTRLLLTRNVGTIVMDVAGVETFALNALGGTDTFTVNDLSGTGATAVTLNLASTIGGSTGDAQADTLIVNATNGANAIAVTGAGTSFSVSGLTATIAGTTSEGANDTLVINGLGGNDTITATTLPAGVLKLTLDGGADADTILGSQGADILLGGDGNDHVSGDNGNDTAFLGTGDDVFEWAPGDGNDLVEGQAGTDELLFAGSNASETINIAANGGRILFLRDVASVTLDLDDVERIRFDAIGGSDNVIVGDLSGTDATHVDVHLQASGGGGDGAVDTVTANGTNGADTIAVTSAGGIVSASGLPVTVRLFETEVANDRLTLNGQGGDDVIDASALAAGFVSLTVNAGLGNDVLIGSAAGDLFVGGDGNDTSLLGAGDDVAVWNPGDDNDIVEGQAGADTLRFNGANIAETLTISANGGRILFFRDIASVTMDLNDVETIQLAAIGGADTILLNDLSGTDLTQLAIDLASSPGGAAGDGAADAVTLNASGGANTITVSGATGALLTVTGLPASVTISQFETGAGADRLTLLALGGNDSISATGLVPHFAALTIDGGLGNDTIRSNGDGTYLGGDGNDTIFAGLTNSLEVIDGGAGVDTLDTTTWGGLYTISLVTGATNYSGESFTNFENLTTGNGADTIAGTSGANIIKTNGGIDTINAGAGDDTVDGGDGDDTIDGGIGADRMTGGQGNDTYTVDDNGDSVRENASEGIDTVLSSITERLSSNVENLTLTGTGNINGTGNGLANNILGNAGNNVLDGGGAADILQGGLGDDIYEIDDVGDIVSEAAGAGTDTVKAHLTYALGANVENLTLTGTANYDGTGNGLDNTLLGNTGNNTLDGMGGADTMRGGLGDDDYVVDNAGDVIVEGSGNGYDRVESSVTHTLGNNVEELTLSGAANINATGNSLVNLLRGNSGNNLLDGMGGADTMKGDFGDDVYVVDDASDLVQESVGKGTDTVLSSVTYTLAVNVENLVLTGTAHRNGTGNSLANTLEGNSGHNILDGMGGADTMRGGAGNDTYVVNNALDVVEEGASAGTDTVQSSLTYTLGNNVENLLLTGTANRNGTGNNLGNALTGNSGNNILDGLGGNDTLAGAAGNDIYIVDTTGDDVIENAGEGTDTVQSTATYTLSANVENLMLMAAGNVNGTGNDLANQVSGNTGNNRISGGLGNDVLSSGSGQDSYVFDTALNAATNIDTIVDFDVPSDTIRLDQTVFTALPSTGTLAADAFRLGTGAADASDRIIYDAANGNLFYDQDGVGGTAQVQFAHLDGNPALTNLDFVVQS